MSPLDFFCSLYQHLEKDTRWDRHNYIFDSIYIFDNKYICIYTHTQQDLCLLENNKINNKKNPHKITMLPFALLEYWKYMENSCRVYVTYTLTSASVLPCNQVMTLYETSLLQGIAASKANMGLMRDIHCIWVERRHASTLIHTYSTDPSFRSLLPIALELTMKPSVSLSGKPLLSSLTILTHPRQK